MFFNKKWLFFMLLYIMSVILYYFINKQLILTGIMSGYLLGSAAVFAVIVAVCFLVAMIISIITKYLYNAGCSLCKVQPKAMLISTCWWIFTFLCYAVVFVIFLKMIEY